LVPLSHPPSPGSLSQIAAEDFHEGGFTRTVGADQAVTVAFAEFDGYVFKQRLCAELHGDAVGRNHYS